MKVFKIGDIADVQFGPYLKVDAKGTVKYLMGGHFDDNYKLNNFSDSYVVKNEKTERFRLQPNDVILAGKGHRTFAWAYSEAAGYVVPSSLFYVLRCHQNVLMGKYFAAVLNSERMQHQLALIGSGVTITSIPKKELKELELLVPPIQEQQKFLEVYNLLDKDIELTDKLLQAKRKLKRGIVNDLLTNKTKS